MGIIQKVMFQPNRYHIDSETGVQGVEEEVTMRSKHKMRGSDDNIIIVVPIKSQDHQANYNFRLLSKMNRIELVVKKALLPHQHYHQPLRTT